MAYVDQLLEEFRAFRGYGIKFQPFKYDLLAAPDYRGYKNYQQLYFTPEQWKQIISKASQTKEIWLDLFDEYSLQVLQENLGNIKGFKVQASVLGNHQLFRKMKDLDLEGKLCILNVSAYGIEEIEQTIHTVASVFKGEIILQVGYQSHPTEFMNSGLSKLPVLRESFPGLRISFTDHLEHNSPDVLLLPYIAHLTGADIIEKHIMCEKLPTQFDHYSSINYLQLKEFAAMAERYRSLMQQPFIVSEEKEYLRKSLLVPMLREGREAGQLISPDDLDYKRCSRSGLDTYALAERRKARYIVAADMPAGATVRQQDLKKATIGAVVVCRMKSTRLPKKALAKIGELTSVELCIKNTLQFEHVNKVVLATSTHPDDAVLKDYTYSDAVGYFEGSENDVIDRFISIADKYALDIIVRVTGDSPYRSNEVFRLLLDSHFEKGADYTAAKNAAIGTNTEIINVQALRKVVKLFNGAPYSEYMSYYFKNNPAHFRLNIVELPGEYCRPYRLTLDYEEDLTLFREIEKELNLSENEFRAAALFDFLDRNPEIAAINMNCEVAYKPDSDLLNKIISYTTLNKQNT